MGSFSIPNDPLSVIILVYTSLRVSSRCPSFIRLRWTCPRVSIREAAAEFHLADIFEVTEQRQFQAIARISKSEGETYICPSVSFRPSHIRFCFSSRTRGNERSTLALFVSAAESLFGRMERVDENAFLRLLISLTWRRRVELKPTIGPVGLSKVTNNFSLILSHL